MSSWKVHLVDNSHQVWNFWLELHLGEHNYELLRRLHVVLSVLQNTNVHGQLSVNVTVVITMAMPMPSVNF
jgi:hypothetical protein